MPSAPIAFGTVLRDRRQHAGLTLHQLAAQARIPIGRLQRIETVPGRLPDLATLTALAKALGCQATDFIDDALGDGQ